jgi:hypothetical protein
MANFLVNLYKTAPKSDGLRPAETPDKYTGMLSKLNASGANKNGTPPVNITSAANTAPSTNTGRTSS